MLDCIILDDGAASPPLVFGLDCSVILTKSHLRPQPSDVLLLNINSEDHSFDSLFELRQKVVANTVIWVLPSFDLRLHDLVVEVAAYYNDRVL